MEIADQNNLPGRNFAKRCSEKFRKIHVKHMCQSLFYEETGAH